MHTPQRERGYSLIEALIATAILGVVALSIFTLFYFGRRNIYSGKQMSQAVVIGTGVLEDLAPLSKKNIYNGAFGLADTATGANITLPRVSGTAAMTFTNSAIRSTNASIVTGFADISTSNNPPDLLNRWQQRIGGKLLNASVTVILTPTQDPTNTPAQFGTARLLRIRVVVRWSEARRNREAIWDTVKSY
jgi:prepilin-type N-terminal cleavage/methylation domain-containing protein